MEDIELGTLLKKARQEKELSLVDIQERTKIRKKYLEAIEANDFDILPGKVYLKVFVKGYAREVDINYDELLKYYPVLSSKEENKSNLHKDYLDGTKVSHKIKRNNNSKKKIFKIIFIVISSLFLIAAAVYTFQYFSNSEIRFLNQSNIENEEEIENNTEIIVDEENSAADDSTKKGQESETNLSEQEELTANNSEDDTDLLNSINSAQLSEENIEIINQNNLNNLSGINDIENDKITEIIASNDLQETNDNLVAETLSYNNFNEDQELDSADDIEIESNESTITAESTNEPEISSAGSINGPDQAVEQDDSPSVEESSTELSLEERQIRFMAADTVWVNVRVDGETAFSGILEVEENREFEIEDQLYIKIGNAGAITALVNGEEIGPWAGTGEIAELEFTVGENEIQINNLRANN